ncbi:MAG: nucleotidyltransferase family protein [Desulfovibrio sp.]|nr:nucleotidyltransferase family protein [Desulfovibrio sp.]
MLTPQAAPIAVIILAAGKAQRMGHVKALLPLGQGSDAMSALGIVTRLYRKLGLRNLLVVSGFHATDVEREAQALGLEVVRNPHPEDGMFSSVRTGLAYITAQGAPVAACIHPVDIPLVRPLTIKAMLAMYEERRQCADMPPVLVPTFNGRTGHPPLIPARHCAHVLACSAQKSLHDALAGLPHCPVPVADALMLEDMDTPGDYAHLCRLTPWLETLFPREALCLIRLVGLTERERRHALAVGLLAAALATALARAQRSRGQATHCRPWLALSGGMLRHLATEQPTLAVPDLLEELGLTRMADIVRDQHDMALQDALTERDLISLATHCCQKAAFLPMNGRIRHKPESRASTADTMNSDTWQAWIQHVEARFVWETGHSPLALASAILAQPSCHSGPGGRG